MGGDDIAAAGFVKTLRSRAEQILELPPRKTLRDAAAERLGDLQHDIGRVARIMKRLRDRLRDAKASKAGQVRHLVVLPPLQIGLVRQNEIGHAARLVEERGETDDERDLFHRLSQRLFCRMIGQRIGREEKQGIHGIRSPAHDSLWQKLRRVRDHEILLFARSVNSRTACAAPCRPVLIDRLERRQRDFS